MSDFPNGSPENGGDAHAGPGAGKAEEALRARVRQQEATGMLSLSALSGTGLPDLLNLVAETVASVLSVEFCEVLELLPDGDRLLLRAGVGWREGRVGEATVGTNLESQAGYTLISRGPVVVEDLRTEGRFRGPPLLREHGAVSGISTTIRIGEHFYGVIGAHTARKRSFTDDEVLFLQEVADVVGAAIERLRDESDVRELLGERTELAAVAERRFEFLTEANALLSTSTDYGTVLATAVRLAVPAVADWCFVDVVEDSGGAVERFTVARSEPGDESLTRELQSRYPLDPNTQHGTPGVLRTGRPELIPDVDDAVIRETVRDRANLEMLQSLDPKSYMCVPLRVGGRTLGAMGFVSSDAGRRYGEEDLALAEGLAYSAAVAIDNARHHVSEAELARELVQRARQDQRTAAPLGR
ncbi:MAG TPA: GAF domain-containing protein, partial [Rubrobacteraceae bacterium]|nr:GAF domain-containing protein [Rubrobacteraceae bacterium]